MNSTSCLPGREKIFILASCPPDDTFYYLPSNRYCGNVGKKEGLLMRAATCCRASFWEKGKVTEVVVEMAFITISFSPNLHPVYFPNALGSGLIPMTVRFHIYLNCKRVTGTKMEQGIHESEQTRIVLFLDAWFFLFENVLK